MVCNHYNIDVILLIYTTAAVVDHDIEHREYYNLFKILCYHQVNRVIARNILNKTVVSLFSMTVVLRRVIFKIFIIFLSGAH